MNAKNTTAAVAALVFTCAGTAAHAQDTTWTCALKPFDSSIVECRESIPGQTIEIALRSDPLPASYTADLFAAGQAKNITRLVRTASDMYAGRTWSIPLISPLIDAQRGRELVQAVMCGREPACDVELTIR